MLLRWWIRFRFPAVAAVLAPVLVVALAAFVSSALGLVQLDLRDFSGFRAMLDEQTAALGPEVAAAMPPIGVLVALQLLSIPVGALFRDGSDWAAFAVAEGRARLRILRIGERNEDLAQVLEGLAEGEQVILHPGDAVADGVRVAPLAE